MTTFSEIAPLLEGQAIEVPSWAYGNSGTRFKVFGSPGTPRTVEEKIADAADRAPVHRARAVGVAAHPVGPGRRLRRAARVRRGPRRRARHDQLQHVPGRRLQARRPDPHRPEDPAEGDRPPLRVHRRHGRDRVARPEDLAGRGHQLPGPGRHARPAGPARREPARRSTTGSARTSGWCWSTSSSSRRSTTPTSRTGVRRTPRWPPSATAPLVCLDTGHHAPGTNIEFIVAQLLRLGKLGSFDFNSRFYADDDLIVGAADPFQLFRILFEVHPRRRRSAPRQRRGASCSTSATTSRRRSPARSGRCSTCRR